MAVGATVGIITDALMGGLNMLSSASEGGTPSASEEQAIASAKQIALDSAKANAKYIIGGIVITAAICILLRRGHGKAQ